MMTMPKISFIGPKELCCSRHRKKHSSMRRRQSFLKVFSYCRDASILYFASRALNDFHGTFGNLLTNGHPVGDAHKVSIFELYPWPFVPVVQYHVESSGFQPMGNIEGGV